ncbi:MAG: hypothetical protein M3R67_12245 [Acidobacteriota bacterium]|nr:hypothetical protein [Acidobacteriota bacterium]
MRKPNNDKTLSTKILDLSPDTTPVFLGVSRKRARWALTSWDRNYRN